MAVTENRVLIGSLDFPTLTLTNDCIKSISGILSLDLVGEELPDDTLEIIFDAVNHLTPVAPLDYADGLESADGDLLLVADDIAFPAMQLPHGCPLWSGRK